MKSRIGRNVAIVLKAEGLIARLRLNAMRRQTALIAIAGLFGVIGLVMLNVAALYALWPVLGPAFSAFFVALINLILAAVLILAARSRITEREIEVITEVRDTALADLEVELEQTAWEARALAAGVRRAVHDPLGTVGAGLLGPILASLFKNPKS
ncbi:phage holin family protein [Tropicimonas isoalkanivorans]|uniref:Putative Holin-X, holin superfamily III n=1 Tax=Tropicimonas isoalkanivorans TaxID=441112 RepID=A0A1I1FT02_9RHOB|nr:phage holin family protein [Tropicimonas isoalkanivorans]SFC02435.1 Putative Holin-X, holin superfamily III [Tropicimonas isoalkanivorans]